MGDIFRVQGYYSEAMKKYEEALIIYEQYISLIDKTSVINNIDETFKALENFPEALKRYEKGLEIFTQLGSINSPNAILVQKYIESFKNKLNFQ